MSPRHARSLFGSVRISCVIRGLSSLDTVRAGKFVSGLTLPPYADAKNIFLGFYETTKMTNAIQKLGRCYLLCKLEGYFITVVDAK